MPQIEIRSTDPGMPSLAGQAGSLITLLDAVLVNGGSTQSITSITRSGSAATVTKVAHGFRDGARVLHAGADQAEYNVEATITRIDANTYSFTVAGTPVSPATGTLTAKMAGAGWAKSFSGTNKAVYRAPQGTRFYLRVDDTGSDATNAAKVATMRGYESMTDVDTGTGDYPTVAQQPSGWFIGKSSTADATTRPWVVHVDGKRIVLLIAYYASLAEAYAHSVFGDLLGASASDAYPAMIFGASSSANAVVTTVGSAVGRGNLGFASATGLSVARGASGTGGAVDQTALSPSTYGSGPGSSTFSPPNAAGEIWADYIQVGDTNSPASAAPRGYAPGVMYLRNYLAYPTYPSLTMFGTKQVFRFGASHAQAYVVETGAWE